MPDSPVPMPSLGDHEHAVLAIDVGGTDIKIALVESDGSIIGLRRVPTKVNGEHTVATVVHTVAREAKQLAVDYPTIRPAAAGVIVPGIVDEEAGVCVYARNLDWHNEPIRAQFEAALSLPVAFGHDVRTAGDAELQLGAGTGVRDAMVVVIGTGIASAVFVNGSPVVSRGFAGEIGQNRVASTVYSAAVGDGPAAPTLEEIASAGAIARRYAEQSGEQVQGSREVLDRMLGGDPVASRVWNEATSALANCIAQAAGMIAPEVILLAGGLALAGQHLVEPIERHLDVELTIQRRPQLILAQLGGDAGLIGSALKARALAAGERTP
ncbi:ROK family protein [Lysinibacter cavernae]|uniref:Glucokinase n=1 Tax=Lysinibacter cavernae TaxID=1640652 RepID=A0A7X5R1D4_9MICO|nr:ROK family protein [Lysinibacter cavernae]NIH53824.1 glucokinase [Lysinibacter cavernae]